MKIATLTYHAAHNYGSMLQAYALQRTIKEMGHDTEIINFRTNRQRQLYNVISKRKNINAIFKDASHLIYYKSLCKKYNLFERFIIEKLITSKEEYSQTEDLKNVFDSYDCVICGSDQIWNPNTWDFDEAYILPYECKRKISYATSFGPINRFEERWMEPFKQALQQFDAISVRENGSKEILTKILGNYNAPIVCDPVFLIDREEWEKIIPKGKIVPFKYVFFYTLFANKSMINMVRQIGKKMNMPVIISNYSNYFDLFSPFIKHLACGPLEFLNLIYNAELVCTSSFHGTAFSCILNRPFVSIDADKDFRRVTLLNELGMGKHAAYSDSEIIINNYVPTEIDRQDRLIKQYKESSLSFLKENLKG